MLKSIEFTIYPTEDQKLQLNSQFGCSRKIYNTFLDYSSWMYKNEGINTFRKDWETILVEYKNYYNYLKQSNSQSLQHELKNLENAFKKFYKKQGGYPKFKSKYDKQSFKVPQFFKLENNLLSIPKIKDLKIYITKDISEYEIRNITIKKTKTNKYKASITYETGVDVPIPESPDINKSLGIDVGLSYYLTTSTGMKIANPKFYKNGERKIKKLSKRFSKKQKGSKNQDKARLNLALHHETIANQRNNFLHQLTHEIIMICNNQGINTICVEDLNIAGLLKNHNLAKSIADASWSEFFRQLKYKCEWFGINLLECGRYDPTSKECGNCKMKNSLLKLSDREWTCLNCGAVHDRDINGADNIVRYAFIKHENLNPIYPDDTGNFKSVERISSANQVNTGLVNNLVRSRNQEIKIAMA